MDLIRCNSCNNKFNKVFCFCPFCGSENSQKENDTSSNRLCPSCNIVMDKKRYFNEVIDICSKCNGLWFDHGELENLTLERDLFTDSSIPRNYKKPDTNKNIQYFKCPVCDTIMSRQQFVNSSGIILNVCPNHGIWLGASEFLALRCFIANGGYRKALTLKVNKNCDQIENIANKLDNASMLFNTIHKFDLRRIMLDKF